MMQPKIRSSLLPYRPKTRSFLAAPALALLVAAAAFGTAFAAEQDFQKKASPQGFASQTEAPFAVSAGAESCAPAPQRKSSFKAAQKGAEVLEPLGPVWPLAEPNLLERFMNRFNAMKADGSYDRKFKENKKQIADFLQTPPAVKGLSKALEIRFWDIEAGIPEKLPARLLAQASRIPLGQFSRALIFIDGKDEQELEAARRLLLLFPAARIVLTRGVPSDVSRTLKRRIFFDQGGSYVRLFGIRATPALLFNGKRGPEGAEFASESLSEFLSELRTRLPPSAPKIPPPPKRAGL